MDAGNGPHGGKRLGGTGRRPFSSHPSGFAFCGFGGGNVSAVKQRSHLNSSAIVHWPLRSQKLLTSAATNSHGQPDGENRSRIHLTAHVNRSAMGFNDGFANGQPQSGAAGPRA